MLKSIFISFFCMVMCCLPLRAELVITTIDAQESALQISVIDSITFAGTNMIVHIHEQDSLSLPITNIRRMILLKDLPSAIQNVEGEEAQVRVYDLSGRCVRTAKVPADNAPVSLEGLPVGTYIIQTPSKSTKLQK